VSLTVVSVGYPFAPVTADPAGGCEQVVSALDRAVTAAGHRSIVIAPEGSCVAGELRALPVPAGIIDDAARASVHDACRAALAAAIADVTPDLVHLHGIDFPSYCPDPGPAVLATLHLPIDWYDRLPTARPRTYLQPVSADQARRAPAGLALIDPIANGVDTDRYRPAAKRDFLLVLGRVSPEKGFHHAIDAARIAGVPLRAAGQVFPYADHLRYFDEQVAPRLDSERVFVGPVAGRAKRDLLAQARAVLIPSTAAETSSLVAMEALASGTPVIAYRSGALPDIVEHGVTGLIVDDVAGMAVAIGAIGSIDPARCRQAALERFPLARTAAAYLDLYRKLAA
jgi:glycosyltransferase involved in cell wall biosynthesis